MKIGGVVFVLIVMFSNCSKSVFVHKSEYGESKFILYKDNYTYVEKTNYSRFKMSGMYEIIDSSLVLVYDKNHRLPYNYLDGNVEKITDKADPSKIRFTIKEKDSELPMGWCTLIARDTNNHTIYGDISYSDGIINLDKNDEIESIEIMFFGFARQFIIYDDIVDYDVVVKMEAPKPGGRMSEGCLIDYIDILLEYKINDLEGVKSFERDGVKFIK